MISELINRLVSPCRDGIARGLLRLRVRPNHVTVLGMLLTVGAGVAIAAGPLHGRTWAIGLLIAAGACDLLDGAMAKVGDLHTRFGGVLDSVCDRASDAALFLGPIVYLVMLPEGGQGRANLTLVILAGLGLVWAYQTSYVRARAGTEGVAAGGGFWQRGERVVTVLLGVGFGHLPTALWILGTLPATTVALRIWRARRALGGKPVGEDEPRGLWGVLLWRYRRGTVPFDLYAGWIIAMLVFWDIPMVDPLRRLIAWLVGA